jgi:4'-phosphopantetheinyl transferase
MSKFSGSGYVKCSFGSESVKIKRAQSIGPEIFYVETKEVEHCLLYLEKHISPEELLRANKFHFTADRNTFISCHALLRLIIGKKLNIDPLALSFIKGTNDKPALFGDPLFFNISHTKDTFAIALSKDFFIGIDIEKINYDLDFSVIMRSYFSRRECEYILEFESNARERFFLLWTRKEALLKAFGTGIAVNLDSIEISEKCNLISKEQFEKPDNNSSFDDIYIYSEKSGDYFLSIAVPYKITFDICNINKESLACYFY